MWFLFFHYVQTTANQEWQVSRDNTIEEPATFGTTKRCEVQTGLGFDMDKVYGPGTRPKPDVDKCFDDKLVTEGLKNDPTIKRKRNKIQIFLWTRTPLQLDILDYWEPYCNEIISFFIQTRNHLLQNVNLEF